MNKILFSSQKDDWETPDKLFKELDNEFHFTLDVCANETNAKVKKFFNEEQNGLIQDWSNEVCWMNPPYGNQIKKWVKKAFEESQKGGLIVGLLPARMDTNYLHNYILPFCKNFNKIDKDIIWASGIFDGKGHVFIRKNIPSEESKMYDLEITVAMSCKNTIEKLRNIFSCGYITFDQINLKNSKWKNVWRWTARSADAIKVLTAIYPYSLTKKIEIFEAIKYSLLCNVKRGHKRIAEELQIQRIFYKLKELKKEKNINFVDVEIRFLKGRLKFVGAKHSAPFPSMIVIWSKIY